MKTYVLMVAKHYPPRVREAIERRYKDTYMRTGRSTQTDFKQKIKNVLSCRHDAFPEGLIEGHSSTPGIYGKIHTIRGNYRLWKKRIDAVNRGEAVISLRQWRGKPYRSKQQEFAVLGRGIVGIQKVSISSGIMVKVAGKIVPTRQVAHNDGLALPDFITWFSGGSMSGCVIHFTSFRY